MQLQRRLVMVPRAGVEPARPFGQRILSPQRLPFRHPGILSVTRILAMLSSFHYITIIVPSRKSKHRETLGTHACAPRASQLLKRRQFSVTVLTPATFQPG